MKIFEVLLRIVLFFAAWTYCHETAGIVFALLLIAEQIAGYRLFREGKP
jgi:hypothetical protein